MVDLRALHASGYSPEKLRQLFVPNAGFAARKPKIKELVDLTTARIHEGVDRQLKHARHWWVIDQACDVSNRAMSATALRGIRSKNPDPAMMIKTMQDWGMSELMNPVLDENGNSKTDLRGNPLFKIDDAPIVEVIAPICQQYLTARWATLVTGRDSSPWLKYSPLVYSRKNHIKTSIITSWVDRTVHEMGYRADFPQEALGALKYGYQFTFSREPYYWERQKQMQESGMVTVVVKEGIRQTMPHPSRTIFDLSHRMVTLNTNTGMEYAGYWDIFRWGSVLSNKGYWLNDDQRGGKFGHGVGLGIESSSWTQYSQLYPTVMNFPSTFANNSSRSDLDRISEANSKIYSNHDQGVLVTHLFQKINPKEWDLFDYDGDVWFCFTMANGDTPLLVEPYCYTPARVMQYQGDQSQWRPTSMVTDLVPFQDSIGNLITQYLMSVRRNLMSLIYYNKDTVKKSDIDVLMGHASGLYTGPNFVPVSFKDAQLDSTTAQISDQFKTVSFSPVDTVSVINAINTMLGIIERVVGFTAQEVGATGAHVQSAQEIRVMTDYAGNRIALTDLFFDSAISAQKHQLYEAKMNYGDDLVLGQIADISDIERSELDSMGILLEEGEGRTIGVMAEKNVLSAAAFASDREGSRRTDDVQLATSIMQYAQTISGHPSVQEALGAEGIFEMFNTIAQFAGLPQESRIRLPKGGKAPGVPQVADQVQQLVGQIMEQQMKEIGDGLRKEVIEPMETLKSKNAEIEQALAQLMGIVGEMRQVVEQPMQTPMQMPMQIPMQS